MASGAQWPRVRGALPGIFGAGVLIAAFAGGQVSASAPSKRVVLQVDVYAAPERTATQQALIHAFEQRYPNITVKLQSSDFNTYYTQLNTEVAGGQTPDVFMMSGAYFQQYAQEHAFLSLASFVKASHFNLSKYFVERDNAFWHGLLYGIPEEVDTVDMAYNTDAFKKAHLPFPSPAWTWSAFLHDAEVLTVDNRGKNATQTGFNWHHIVQYGFYDPNNAQENWGDWIESNGGAFLNSSLTKPALDSRGSSQALQFLYNLMYRYHVAPTPQSAANLPGYTETLGNAFMTGKVAMSIEGNYSLPSLLQIKSFHWDIAPLPLSPRTRHARELLWTQAWVIGAHTAHAQAAWDFINFWSSPKAQAIFGKLKSAIPPLKTVAYRMTVPPPAHVRDYLNNYKTAGSFQFNACWFQYQNAMSKALDSAWLGQTTMKTAIANADASASSALASCNP